MNYILHKKNNFFNFTTIKFENIVFDIENSLKKYKKIVKNILKKKEKYNWDNFCQPLEEANNDFLKKWSPIAHLYSVKNTPELRKIYEKCLLKISKFNTWLGQNKKLYKNYLILKNNSNFKTLKKEQKKHIENSIINFELSGIKLKYKEKNKYEKIIVKIQKLENLFNNNVLDSTMGWKKLISNLDYLSGIPKYILKIAEKEAKLNGKNGWLLTLDFPIYSSVINYADNRDLRKEIYYAYNTRASDQGPNAKKWDNTEIIKKILILRQKIAKLLGFKNYAEKSIFRKMARSTKEVLNFLTKIGDYAYPKAKQELEELKNFALKKHGIKEIKPWDLMYYSEKQKKNIYLINNEKIRHFFPEKKVLFGLFKIIYKIYGFKIKKHNNFKVWHPNVQFFKIYDKNKNIIGNIYLDLYSRKEKNSGAWMNDALSRLKYSDGSYQIPVAYIVCNFNKPAEKKYSLLTHNEIITLFHEFGHALHHLLTKINVPSVSGINGIPWDAVEFPSQFMENWCWQPKILKIISSHYKTNEPMPKSTILNLLKSKNYQSGLFILQQVKIALFDFQTHIEYSVKNRKNFFTILKNIHKKYPIIKNPKWNRFPNTFSHIFSGNYAAGYYSYLWAEVLASDAFSRFLKEGILNRNTGKSFLKNILSLGGTEDPRILFKKFLNRKPNIKSMLKKYNIN